MFRKKTKQILVKFNEQEIIKQSIGANFFGQESLGIKQIRGNGVLILTKEELFFELWLPSREFQIPIKRIQSIEITKWHLKKTKGRPLLKVHYINDSGSKDSCAWWINDLNNWVNLLESLRISK